MGRLACRLHDRLNDRLNHRLDRRLNDRLHSRLYYWGLGRRRQAMRFEDDGLAIVFDDSGGRCRRAGLVNAAGRFFDNAHVRS
jgi:hypothetical protein